MSCVARGRKITGKGSLIVLRNFLVGNSRGHHRGEFIGSGERGSFTKKCTRPKALRTNWGAGRGEAGGKKRFDKPSHQPWGLESVGVVTFGVSFFPEVRPGPTPHSFRGSLATSGGRAPSGMCRHLRKKQEQQNDSGVWEFRPLPHSPRLL